MTRGKHRAKMLGGGLEPPCLAAYAPQTYVSAISPPERVRKSEAGTPESKKGARLASLRQRDRTPGKEVTGGA